MYEPDEVRSAFSDSNSLLQVLESTLLDATYTLRIAGELNVLPLAAQISNVCGNVLSRTLAGGRSERNEYLLLHAFTERSFIVPDKVYGKRPVHHADDDHDNDADGDTGAARGKSGRRKPAYTGGLVLEPKRGFYDKYVLLVDFNSLYPSIIQEYNICFTTVASSHAEGQVSQSVLSRLLRYSLTVICCTLTFADICLSCLFLRLAIYFNSVPLINVYCQTFYIMCVYVYHCVLTVIVLKKLLTY